MRINAFRNHFVWSTRTSSVGVVAGAAVSSSFVPTSAFIRGSSTMGLPGSFSTATSTTSSRSLSSTSTSTSSSDDGGDTKRICSSRAGQAVELLPTYLADARAVEKYSPSTPNGALQLSVAENQMLEDLLVPSLTEFSSSLPFPADAIYYQPTQGRESFRRAMAGYLNKLLGLSPKGLSLDVDGVVVGAGCNAVLENLCLCLAEPGESVLIPTPYYAAFEFDLVARAGLNIVPVTTMDYCNDFDPSHSIPESAYYPSRAALDAAANQASKNGRVPKVLLLSHPQNPLGICYPPHVMKECIDWCRENQIHLVSDEIYAGSVYAGNDVAKFKSAMELGASNDGDDNDVGLGLGPYIHLVYALSKDFALSGLRVGVSYSENPAIRLPLQKLNDLCCISSHTQMLVERMLTATDASGGPSTTWTDQFLEQNHQRLLARATILQTTLDELDIPYLHSTAGLFVWMDLREFLPSATTGGETPQSDAERERTLYLELLMDYGLLFTPGKSMKNELPGFFRCVFSAASEEEFTLGLERLKTYVHDKRSS